MTLAIELWRGILQIIGTYMWCGRKVMKLIFYLQKFLFFTNITVIPFKIVSLGSYTPMEMFPLLVAALEVFYRYGLQHVHSTLLDVFESPEIRSFEDIFKFRKKSKGLSGEQGGWRTTGMPLRSKILCWSGQCDMGHCHDGASICLQCLVSCKRPFF